MQYHAFSFNDVRIFSNKEIHSEGKIFLILLLFVRLLAASAFIASCNIDYLQTTSIRTIMNGLALNVFFSFI